MASSAATTVEEYLTELPPERAAVVRIVRDTLVEHLPAGYEERMDHGMICYAIPLERHPDTYNGRPLGAVSLAAQKRHFSLYLNAVYTSPELERRLRDGYAAAGLRIDMGQSCLRFKGLDDIDLDVIGDIVAAVAPAELIATYQSARASG